VICDPQVVKERMFQEIPSGWGKIMLSGFPVKFSKAPKPIRLKGPVKPDSNREEILAEIGFKEK
jgi:crotonobetainyl-CoA:carnitine CoA-transferase CaiB-like acyl-CoA transferase